MRFLLSDKNLVVAGRVYEGFPLLINDDGDAIQPAQAFLWDLLTRSGRITSKKSWENYGRAIYDFFAFSITNGFDWKNPAIEGRPTAIEAWRDWSRGTLNLKTNTINSRLRLVVRFYEWAMRTGRIERTPFDYVTVRTDRSPGFLHHVNVTGNKVNVPQVVFRQERQHVRLLTREQIVACHETLQTNLTHQLMFELMVRTGLRQGECRSFPDAYVFDPTHRNDLHPDRKIRIDLNPMDLEIKFSRARSIDMPFDLMDRLWLYSLRQRQRRANNNPNAELPNLFLTEQGRAYGKTSLNTIFTQLSARVGFAVTPHMLRHSYATYLLWSLRKSTTFQGEPLLYVRDRMGHTNLTTTTIYLHLVNSLEGSLVLAHEDEIDGLLRGPAGGDAR
jgi:integrase/recombinase XerD